MEDVLVVYISIPREEATSMAKGIVENRLSACINILPRIESVFWWGGKVEYDEEALLIVKTTKSKFDALEQFVRENHPYELPEIIGMPLAAAFSEYVAWIHAETEKA